MLVLTLYQNCILSEEYQEVFSLGKRELQSISVLEEYLNTLNKSMIIIDNVYYENSGEFVIDSNLFVSLIPYSIYTFNYLKVEVKDDITHNLLYTRYCFIKDIMIKNGCVYLEYNEDVWSSYADGISQIIYSYLENSRFVDYTNITLPIKKLPIEYESNKPLIINRISTDNDYKIYMEIQYYKLGLQGEVTDRYSMVYLIDITNSSNRTWTWVGWYIQKIINSVGAGYVAKDNTDIGPDDKFQFEVGDIYVVPSNIVFALTLPSSDDLYIFDKDDMEICHTRRLNFTTGNTIGLSYTITSNYKNLKIGTFANQIDIVNLGQNCTAQILTSSSETDISIRLNCQNQIVDITDDFKFNMPYQSLRSEEVILDKLNRKMNLANWNTEGKNIAYSRIEELLSLNFSSIITRFMGSILDIEKTTSPADKFVTKKAILNTPQYSSTKGVFGNNTNFLNSFYGIVLFSIDSINDEFVKNYINRYGYQVYNFINEWSDLNLNNNITMYSDNLCNYNVIKFETANVIGNFPRTIAIKLNDILENGLKIWFNPSRTEDNYVV